MLDLLSLVIAHRAVLLYAQSGAGKSSLLNAGLIPMLVQEGFDVLPTARLRGIEPVGGLEGDMTRSASDRDRVPGPERVFNIYAFNTVVRLTPTADPASLLSTTLDAWFTGRPHSKDEYGDDRPRLLIIDQFEELFTAYPECAKQREVFMQQIARALEADPLLRVLFAIREDYLAGVDPFATLLPEHLRVRYRMERLGPEAACSAVVEPASALGRSFAEGAADQLVAQLLVTWVEDADGKTRSIPGECVEPVQLQVVCKRLWDMLPADVKEINAELIGSLGNVDEALREFYETALKKAVSEPEVTEKMLRTWFEKKLITSSGTRSTVHRDKDDTGGLPNATIDRLEEAHIIRAEQRGGARWYELTHDRLIQPILESNRRWTAALPGVQQISERYEAKADDWAQHGRQETLLLAEADLAAAQGCLNCGGEVSDRLESYVSASRAKLERDATLKIQRMRDRAILMRNRAVVAAVVALVLALFAVSQFIRAESRRRAADADRLASLVKTRMDYPYKKGPAFAALDSLRKAIRESPESPRPHALLGVSLAKDSPAVAITELKKAVATPQFAEGYTYRCTLAQLYARRGDTDAAMSNLNVAIGQNPEFAGAHVLLGLIYRDQGNYARAIEHFRSALPQASDSGDVMLKLAETYWLKGLPDSAKVMLDSAQELSPNLSGAYQALGRLYFLQRKFPEAVAEFTEAQKRTRPSSPSIFAWLGITFDSLKNRSAAAASNYRLAAQYFRGMSRYDSARVYAEKAWALAPADGDAIRELAWVVYHFDDTARFDTVAQMLQSSLVSDTASEDLEILGLIRYRQRDYDEAKSAMLWVRTEDSSSFYAWQTLGMIYLNCEYEYDAAYSCLLAADHRLPSSVILKLYLAEASLAAGRFSEADSMAKWVSGRGARLSGCVRSATRFVILAAHLCQNDPSRARVAFDSLCAAAKESGNLYEQALDYEGVRNFISTHQELPEKHRRLLLDILNDYLDPAPDAQPSESLERLKKRI